MQNVAICYRSAYLFKWKRRYNAKTLKVMKLTGILLLGFCLHVAAKTASQTISLSGTNLELRQVFQEVEKQTNYSVFYNKNAIEGVKVASIDAKNIPLKEFLEILFQDLPFQFYFNKNTIVISRKSVANDLIRRLEEDFSPQFSPPIKISGTIVGQNNQLLSGATIRVKGKNITTASDDRGYFELNAEAPATLIISYVGFQQREYKVNNSDPLSISLMQLESRMDTAEVILNTGYQQLSKERATGSFVHIDNELYNRQVGTDVLSRIYNVTSGLITDPRGGGNKNELLIRGVSTINALTQPLIVVDNFPYEGDLSSLNPNDVSSITVLKDAAAASIWGVRAGNGVIVVTTKQGKLSTAQNITINNTVTVTQKPDLFYLPVLSSAGMIDVETEQFKKGVYNDYDDVYPSFNYFPMLPQAVEVLLAARRKGIADPANDPAVKSTLAEMAAHDIRNDIDKYMLRNAMTRQHFFSISGGNTRYGYYTSVGYDAVQGEDIKNNNNRISINFKNTFRPFKNLELNGGIAYTRTTGEIGGLSYGSALPGFGWSVYTRLADKQGNALATPYSLRSPYVDTVNYPGLLDWHYYPLNEINNKTVKTKGTDARVEVNAKYSILDGLMLEGQFQVQQSNLHSTDHMLQKNSSVTDAINKTMYVDDFGNMVYPHPLGDVISRSGTEFTAWNIRTSLRFDKRWNAHQLNAFAGIELRESSSETNYDKNYGYDPLTHTYTTVDPLTIFPARPFGSVKLDGSIDPVSNIARHGSSFINVNYDYQGKYLLLASARMDESNFFGIKANLRKVPLWSVGTGWNMHLENFYNLSWLSALKWKVSYGFTGNTNPGATSHPTFEYLNDAFIAYVPLRNILFGKLLTPGNPQLRWERVKVFNVGAEFTFRKERISGSIEYYRKKGLDLLGPVNSDPTSGVTDFWGNRSSILTKGLDITINSNNLAGKLRWQTSLLVSFNKDEVVEYLQKAHTVGLLLSANAIKPGEPLSTIYSFRWAGLDPASGEARVFLGDTLSKAASETQLKESDLVKSGRTTPTCFGSLRNSISYGAFSVSALITYRFGHVFRRPTINYSELLNFSWTAHKDYDQRWQKPGDEKFTNVPAMPASILPTADIYQFANILIERADCIKLQDVRIDYRLRKQQNHRNLIRDLSVYFVANNLGMIWKANKYGIDPEAYLLNTFPAQRSFSLGFNITF